MNRRTDQYNNQESLGSKYPLKERQRTLGVLSSKPQQITLSDLCPEDKLKIGELIKINESRKQEIEELHEKQASLQSALVDSQSQLLGVQEQYQSKQCECEELNRELQLLKIGYSQMQTQLKQLSDENSHLRQCLNKANAIVRVGVSVQTQSTQTTSYAAQTKKLKYRTQGMQTNTAPKRTVALEQYSSSSSQERTHSRSLGKKRPTSSQRHRSKSNRQSKDSFVRSKGSKHYPQQAEAPQDDVDECFEDLTRKWLHLKEQNLSRLKASYQDSRYKFSKELGLTPELSPFQEEQRVVLTEASDSHQIDESVLNTLLKSKDFSASRLLAKKYTQDPQPPPKKFQQPEPVVNEDNDKSKRDPFAAKDYRLNIEAKRGRETEMLGQESGDLMDLVDSLW